MRWQPTSQSLLFRDRRMALGALVALMAAIAVSAAPPEKTKPEPAKPIDPPQDALSLPFEAQRGMAAALTVGDSFAPRSGPWCTLSALYAGTHPDVNLWDLHGPLSTRPGRIQIGAGTLFLNGFGPIAALRAFGTLQAGDAMECWNLINTDEVRPIPPLLLQNGFIRDRHGIFNGDLEIEAYSTIIVMAHFTSQKAFAKAARHDVTFTHLFNEPERYRGQVVHVSGRLIRLHRFDPQPEARAEGVGDLYEGWIMTDKYGENPVCVVFTDLPPGLRIENDHKYNIDDVGFDGYFYKRYRYKASDSKKANEFRDSPLLIGHTLTGKFGPNAPAEAETVDNWGHHLIWVFLGVVGAALVGVIGLTCWFRYHDRRIRHRIGASRHTGFVPPTDELFADED